MDNLSWWRTPSGIETKESIKSFTNVGPPIPQDVRTFLTTSVKNLSPFEIRQYVKPYRPMRTIARSGKRI